MKIELNSRQWALYNYLKDKGDEWTTQFRVAIELPEYGFVEGLDDADKFHDSPARHLLTKDIQVINKSNVIQKIILSSGKGIKLASDSDFDVYIRSQYAALWRRKERLDKIAKKGKKDGQMRIVFGSERDTIKSFIDSDRAIGKRLREARYKTGMSANEVVWQLQIKGFDAPMLSKIERGYVLPNKTTLKELAEIYGVSVDYLLTGELSPDKETNENNGLQAVKGG